MIVAYNDKDSFGRATFCSVFDNTQSFNCAMFMSHKYRIWPDRQNSSDDGETVYNNTDNYEKNWEEFKEKVKKHFDFQIPDNFKPWYVKP